MCKLIIRAIKERKARKQVLKMDDVAIDQKIKIQGTDFDRKRLLKKADVEAMKRALDEGMSVSAVANLWNVSYHAVKYNTDDAYRAAYNAKRYGPGTHSTGSLGLSNRAAYKRELVKTKQIRITY